MNLRAWLWRVQLRHCCWCSSFHVVSREFLSGDDFSEVPLDTSDCMLTPASTSCNYNQDEERLENLPALPGHAYSLFMEPNNAHNGALRPRSMLWWCPIQTLAVLPSGFALLAPLGNLQHRAFGCVPLGEQCCVSPRLIVNDFQGTPRGVILHKAVMLAYAFPDPWLSATAIFSILAKVWPELPSYVCVSFSFPALSTGTGTCLIQPSRAGPAGMGGRCPREAENW